MKRYENVTTEEVLTPPGCEPEDVVGVINDKPFFTIKKAHYEAMKMSHSQATAFMETMMAILAREINAANKTQREANADQGAK